MANRPHVRFDGRTLSAIGDQRWADAQNDALGYFLWLSSTLAASGALKPDANAVSVLTRFVRYFAAIRFWQDEDSGHWEEQRKVSASSIGTVVAGLEAFADLLRQRREWWQACGPALDLRSDHVRVLRASLSRDEISRGSRETGLSFQSLARADH